MACRVDARANAITVDRIARVRLRWNGCAVIADIVVVIVGVWATAVVVLLLSALVATLFGRDVKAAADRHVASVISEHDIAVWMDEVAGRADQQAPGPGSD